MGRLYFDHNKRVLHNSENKVITDGLSRFIGLFDFDGSSWVRVLGTSVGNIMGNRTIKWYMWLDSIPSPSESMQIFCFWPNVTYVDIINVSVYQGLLHVQTKMLPGSRVGGTFVMTGYTNQVLSCEVKKTSTELIHFKINNVTQTSQGLPLLGGNVNLWCVGFSSPTLDHGTVWDIQVINDDTVTLLDRFMGYPDGNTNASWINVQSSSATATITNSQGTGTRNID